MVRLVENGSTGKTSERGLTLVELLITLVLLSVILTLAVNYFASNARFLRLEEAQAEVIRNLTGTAEYMASLLRMAGYDPRSSGNFGLTEATDTSLFFTLDADSDGVVDSVQAEIVGFYRSGDTLYRYNPEAPNAPILVTLFVDYLGFYYYDAEGRPIPSPLPSPYRNVVLTEAQRAQVRSARLVLVGHSSRPVGGRTFSVTLPTGRVLRGTHFFYRLEKRVRFRNL